MTQSRGKLPIGNQVVSRRWNFHWNFFRRWKANENFDMHQIQCHCSNCSVPNLTSSAFHFLPFQLKYLGNYHIYVENKRKWILFAMTFPNWTSFGYLEKKKYSVHMSNFAENRKYLILDCYPMKIEENVSWLCYFK